MSERPSIIITYWKSPVGELILGSYKNELCLCDWRYRKMRSAVDSRIQKFLGAGFLLGNSEVIEQTINQLEAYFRGEITPFPMSLLFCGTAFQKSVWEALQRIPYGETKSYLELSQMLGNEKAIRAVASANGANAISILVPCHRVIGLSGELTGYAGGIPAKKKLLELEGAFKNEQLELF